MEKPIGSTSPLTADGSFDIGVPTNLNAPWSLLTAEDLRLGRFKTAIKIDGMSPDHQFAHEVVEFQLSLNLPKDPKGGNGPNGIYSPDPAFWSASVGGKGASDPPISSEIFQLRPDGSTALLGGTGPGGIPVLTHAEVQAVPEPVSIAGAIFGIALAAGIARFRKS